MPAFAKLVPVAQVAAEALAEAAERAREKQWPYEQFLEVLPEDEVFAHELSSARRRTRHASFPAHKMLEDIDYTPNPQPSGRWSCTSRSWPGSRSTRTSA